MTRRAIAALGLLSGLACSGLPGAPAGPGGDASLPPSTGVTLTWLAPAKDGCSWMLGEWPGGATRVLATLGGPCPVGWSIVVDDEQAAVIGGGTAWRVDLVHGTATALPPAPMPLDLVTFDGGRTIACVALQDAQRTEADGEITLAYQGKDYAVEPSEDEGLTDAGLGRSFALADGRWVEGTTAAYRLSGLEDPPTCDRLPDFPAGAPRPLPGPSSVYIASEPWTSSEDPALKALTNGSGGWAISPDGRIALVGVDLENGGMYFEGPVAWKQGGTWSLVPTLGDGTVKFELDRHWLLGSTEAGSHLWDTATGESVWSGTGRAVLWPSDVPVPGSGGKRAGGRREGKAKVKVKAAKPAG